MIEVISKDSEKIVFKDGQDIRVKELKTGDILFIDSFKHGTIGCISSSGIRTYSSMDNRIKLFPQAIQDKFEEEHEAYDFYCRHGYDNYQRKKSSEPMASINTFVQNTVNTALASTSSNNATIEDSNGAVTTCTPNEDLCKDNVDSRYLGEKQKIDNSRFPADASCQDLIEKEKEIKLFNNVTYKGHTIPKCKGMICNSSGEVTNIVETKDKLYCNGYELFNGEIWRKTFSAKLKCLFRSK